MTPHDIDLILRALESLRKTIYEVGAGIMYAIILLSVTVLLAAALS